MQITINVGSENTMYNEVEQLMVYIEFTSKYPHQQFQCQIKKLQQIF